MEEAVRWKLEEKTWEGTAFETQQEEKVERMDDIVAKIEENFATLSDEVLLVALRKGFEDVRFVFDDPDESAQGCMNVKKKLALRSKL